MKFYKVVISPKGLGNYGFASITDRAVEPDESERKKRYKERCEGIVEQARRHVDLIGDIEIIEDEE